MREGSPTKDLALVGVDDFEKAQEADPPLTTVRQSFGLVAATAATTLLDHLATGSPLPSTVRVPTAFVARQSCGCSASFSLPPLAGSEPSAQAERLLARALLKVAARGRTGEGSATWRGAQQIARLLGAVSGGQADIDGQDLNALWSEFLEGNRDATTVDDVLSVIETTIRGWQSDATTELSLRRVLRQLRITLIRNWRRLEIERNRYYEFVAEANSKINHALAVCAPKTASICRGCAGRACNTPVSDCGPRPPMARLER